ncbi:MAG: sigma-70 family RNA polymerase sigma factor [Planctomycetes bacterium]|nr:sigma-70 family RNA polymerase sigma factor [Planctomycetota bacterium]MCC7170114.1 sigma-70 family RNA polymerase sigma factor [Planctomycetota bacterium]
MAEKDLSQTLYAELRRIAAAGLRRERAGHTLQPTDLVHELWLRQAGDVAANNRSEFLRNAAATMRRVLVDHARRRARLQRGNGRRAVPLSGVDAAASAPPPPIDLLALDDALTELMGHRALCAQIVELRFFAGFDMAEIATALNVSKSTVEREYALARAWLQAKLAE